MSNLAFNNIFQISMNVKLEQTTAIVTRRATTTMARLTVFATLALLVME